MAIGILFGLLAALLQSLSYLVSASFVRSYQDRPAPSWALLARSYIWMGAFSGIATAWILLAFPGRFPPLTSWAWGGALSIFLGMAAQVILFFTLKAADASRVSPLLGIKILFLAFSGMIFDGDRFSAIQWGGIGLALAAAYLLSCSGGKLSLAGLIGVIGTSICFAAADTFIKVQQDVFHAFATTLAANGGIPLSQFMTNLLVVFVDYSIGGILALAILPFTGRYPRRATTHDSLLYAAVWLGAMILLFVSFDAIGLVHGNIVQSTRGLLSIVLGYAIARAGGVSLERRLSRSGQAGRFIAGLLMFLSIVLFTLGA